jgi:hypothetical protein
MSGHKHTYTIDVAADSAEEAIAVAAEALPKGATLSHSQAEEKIPGTWQVSLQYQGGVRHKGEFAG